MSRFEGKSIVVTGAASGLGLATAQRLAQEGARLALVDLDRERLADLEAVIASPAAHLYIAADVANGEDCRRYVADAADAFGTIDGFFNNAGIEGRQGLTEDYDWDEFRRVLSINLDGVFFGMAEMLRIMKRQGVGSIVNTASVGGIRGVGNQSGYAASKHGVVGLTRNSAVEYGQYGIQINAVAPGAIMTPMVEGSLRQVGGDDWEEVGRQFVAINPMRRFGRPEEVAAVVCFLLSGEASFVNGAVIPIDGGQSYKY